MFMFESAHLEGLNFNHFEVWLALSKSLFATSTGASKANFSNGKEGPCNGILASLQSLFQKEPTTEAPSCSLQLFRWPAIRRLAILPVYRFRVYNFRVYNFRAALLRRGLDIPEGRETVCKVLLTRLLIERGLLNVRTSSVGIDRDFG